MRRKISLLLLAILAQGVWAQGYFEVSQGGLTKAVQPLVGTQDAASFYAYTQFPAFSSNCPLAAEDTAVLFLYRDPAGDLYLFVIYDTQASATGGSAELSIQGIPPTAQLVVQDDPDTDSYDLTTGRFSWSWTPNHTDGMVLGPLGQEFQLTISPVTFTGINTVAFLSGNIAAPERIELNTVDTITIIGSSNRRPVVSFTISPTEPRVNDEVTFDASASYDPDGTITEYRWDFDGDGVVDLVTKEPTATYVYKESGDYSPVLTAVDNAGASSSYTGTLHVSPLGLVATRSISTMTALPGSTFRVTVRIHADRDMVGVGLDEDLPVGWEITPVDNGGAIFKRSTTQWVFLDKIRAGSDRVITYDVTVPEADVLRAIRLPQRFCIQGSVQAKVPEAEVPVGGESCVMVNDCLPVLEAVAHLIPAEAPGQEDKIDLRLPETITEKQLQRAAELWATDRPVVGTCGAVIDQATLKRIAAYAISCTPIDRPLPKSKWPKANVTVTRTIIAPIPCQGVVLGFQDAAGNPIGNTFTVKLEVTTDSDVIAVGIDEDLPVGWKVTPLDNGGFVYKPSKLQWTYLGILKAGETRTVVYKVEVPPTLPVEPPPPEQCGVYDIEHIVGVADTGLPCIENIPIGGDNRVEITKCLNVIVAISRWDVKRDTVDLSLSDFITLPQVQRAVAFWLEDETVPYTCGAKIDYETLKEIIALWLTNTPICEALPSAPPGKCQDR